MIVGLPKEIKDNEYRVGLTPAGVRALKDANHEIHVEASAGEHPRGLVQLDIRCL